MTKSDIAEHWLENIGRIGKEIAILEAQRKESLDAYAREISPFVIGDEIFCPKSVRDKLNKGKVIGYVGKMKGKITTFTKVLIIRHDMKVSTKLLKIPDHEISHWGLIHAQTSQEGQKSQAAQESGGEGAGGRGDFECPS